MTKIKEYNVGDMVEHKVYIRSPKLKGIIIKNLGFDKYLNDIIYLIHCFSFKPPKKLKWKHKEIEKIS
tara:strand:- start:935 stop:1138 length:204 start_codon:yes stop_codon:yes gene_type:complete